MAINKLYLLDKRHKWSDDSVILLNADNLQKIIDDEKLFDCRTSIADLGFSNVGIACGASCEIDVGDITIDDSIFSSYGRLLHELLRNKHKVIDIDKLMENFRLNKINVKSDKRKSNKKTLWTAGCSMTVGVGVDQKERWGTLLSNMLGLPETSLSLGGSSIYWASDQILRSDIRKDDIIVWGLTNVPRVEISDNWKLSPYVVQSYADCKKKYWNLDYFDSETLTLKCILSILHVINFCQKIGAELYLVNLLDLTWIPTICNDYENFIDLTADLKITEDINISFIDLGTDNHHPGPKQHQQYAEKIFNFIKENNHGKTI
jgi:hypothetical protein